MDTKKYLYFNSRDESYRIDILNIVYFEADGNYTNFFYKNKQKGVVLMNLSQTEATLNEQLKEDASIFSRIGKRFIINLNYVYHIEVLRQKLTLSDGETFSYQLPISKDALKKLKDKTKIPFNKVSDEGALTQCPSETPTNAEANAGSKSTLGRIYVPSLGISFPLELGKNLIGRKASGSAVPIQIPCQNKRMSREHLVIEINKTPAGLVHYVYLNKKQANPTYIGGNLLEYGDKIILKHRDIIKLPDMDIRFEILDEEETEMS